MTGCTTPVTYTPSRLSLAAASRCDELTNEACDRSSGIRPRVSGFRGVRLGWWRISSMWRTVERRISAIPVDAVDRGCCVPPKSSTPRGDNLRALLLRGCCGALGRVASWSCLCFSSSWRPTSCCTATSGLTGVSGPLSTSVLECAGHIGFTSLLCPITPAPGTAWSACSFGRRCGRYDLAPPDTF
jgi:hypothetical protein